MAQTGERKQSGATAPASGNGQAQANGERKSFWSRLAPSRVERTNASSQRTQAAQPARPPSEMGKFLRGWLILMIVLYAVTLGLQLADVKWFNLALERPWFHTNALIIGGLNWYFVITLLVIGLTYYLLIRFKLIPRDPFGTRARMQQNQAQSGRSGSGQTQRAGGNGKPAPDGLSKAPRTRAARRHSTSTTVAATTAAPSARRVAAKARTETPPPAASTPSGHDDEYLRVKAAQRARRRREAKR